MFQGKLTKVNKKSSVTLTLVLRHGHNAGNVVLLLAELLFGKVADQMTALAIVDSQYVK